MSRANSNIMLRVARLLTQQTPRLDQAELARYVQRMVENREPFLDLARQKGSPLYVFDTRMLVNRARQFKAAFENVMPEMQGFYALKSNSHPIVASTLVEEGLGLDVSSGLELSIALDCGAQDILFSGPGKTDEELELALQHTSRVTILLDSFGELERLSRLARQFNISVRAGVRLTTDESGIWRKFGVPPNRLPAFFEQAGACRHIRLCGVQFHLSWNLNPEPHVVFIVRLGNELRHLKPRFRERIEFIDIGGGFWPAQGEWLQFAETPQGLLQKALGRVQGNARAHFRLPASSIESFAAHISQALQKHIPREIRYRLFAEPGRWLCNDAMHIVLTVIDRKADNLVITDGGINAVGWERFESDYIPLINLSRPSLTEQECMVAGSLCTPHDIWGYSYFGEDIQVGDTLLVPDQGAYTYSLRQEFIKPLPKVVELQSVMPVKPSGGTLLERIKYM